MLAVEVSEGWNGELHELADEEGKLYKTWDQLMSLAGKALANLGINRQDIERLQQNALLDPAMFQKDAHWREFVELPIDGTTPQTQRAIEELADPRTGGFVLHEETVIWGTADTFFIGERPWETEAA